MRIPYSIFLKKHDEEQEEKITRADFRRVVIQYVDPSAMNKGTEVQFKLLFFFTFRNPEIG